MPRPRAFTLIELLVVITIIVVLLALIAPALDQAMYQAELAVCGSNLYTLASGSITYAADQRRHYPHRPTVFSPGWSPQNSVQQGQTNVQFNDRPYLAHAFALDSTLNDPLVRPIDIDAADDASWIWTSYNLWVGFRYFNDKGMLRLGDRLEFSNRGSMDSPYRFRLLASDIDRLQPMIPFYFGSHPDKAGLLRSVHLQDQDAAVASKVTSIDIDFKSTLTRWQGAGRGLIDMNSVYDDGAVQRSGDVSVDSWDPSVDGRMVKVGVNTAASNYDQSWDHLPAP